MRNLIDGSFAWYFQTFFKTKNKGKNVVSSKVQKRKKEIKLSIYLHKSPVYKCLGFLDSRD